MNQTLLKKVSAPSSSLLKFLRSQSEATCFFTGGVPASSSSSSYHQERQGRLGQWSPPSTRCLSTAASTTHHLRPQYHHHHHHLYHLKSNNHSFRRAASTTSTGGSNSSLWNIFELGRRSKNKKRNSRLEGDVVPPPLNGFLGEGTDGTMLNFGRTTTISNKAPNEKKLRCTEFDENGNVTLVNGEFKKSELIAKYGLLPRDLRKIDSSLLPSILVRESAILINLLHIRALIKHNRVLVFDAYGSTDSHTQSLFMYDLEGKLRQREGSRQAGGLPYELRALEAILISVTTALEIEFEGVRGPVVQVLRDLEEDIDRDKLRYLLIYSKKLGTFEQKAKLVRDAIDELLDADDDLAAMYLTTKANGGKRGEDDHTEVEMLLESYHKVCDEIFQASGNLVSNIRNTEEIVKAILDANRNSLILLDLKFSIGTLGIGGGTLIAGLYGMNLKNTLEESDLGFWGVSGASLVIAGYIIWHGLCRLRKVQRVSMRGEEGSGARRGRWGDVGEMGISALGPGGPGGPGSGIVKAWERERASRLAAMSAAAAATGTGVAWGTPSEESVSPSPPRPPRPRPPPALTMSTSTPSPPPLTTMAGASGIVTTAAATTAAAPALASVNGEGREERNEEKTKSKGE